MSSTSSSPASWILQQQNQSASIMHHAKRNMPSIEPLNLWPSTSSPSTWAYGSALGTLSANGNEMNSKYTSRNSPLTPTTPTCSPVLFSPVALSSFVGVAGGQQQHPPPDSPHSVVDGYLDFPAMTEFFPMHTSNSSKRPQQDATPISSQNKRSKCFTIDAILGLDDFRASCRPSNEESFDQRRTSSPESSSESLSPRSLSSALPMNNHSTVTATTVASSGSSMRSSSAASSPRAKRVRTIFSAEQLERLEAEFARQQYMVGPERLVLAASLRLSESQVKVWFQNRRIKWRKQHLEAQQMRLVTWRQHEEHEQQQLPLMLADDDDHHSSDSLSD